MNPNSMFGIRHWDLPQILFVAAGCFAMAAVGFFIAVFLQYKFSGNTGGRLVEIPVMDKEAAYQQPYERGDGQTTTPVATIANQVDENDPHAGEKLKAMQAQYER